MAAVGWRKYSRPFGALHKNRFLTRRSDDRLATPALVSSGEFVFPPRSYRALLGIITKPARLIPADKSLVALPSES